jgi:hypothetical protein
MYGQAHVLSNQYQAWVLCNLSFSLICYENKMYLRYIMNFCYTIEPFPPSEYATSAPISWLLTETTFDFKTY